MNEAKRCKCIMESFKILCSVLMGFATATSFKSKCHMKLCSPIDTDVFLKLH
jgi:hypothetical protein